jgi:hypothetical protein
MGYPTPQIFSTITHQWVSCEAMGWHTNPPANPPPPPPAAPPEDPTCVLTADGMKGMTTQQYADWLNAHAACLGAKLPPGEDLVPQAPTPPKPIDNPLSPLDVDCLKLERDMKDMPPGADTAAEIATKVPIGMLELTALGICGIDAVGFNIAADAKGTKK